MMKIQILFVLMVGIIYPNLAVGSDEDYEGARSRAKLSSSSSSLEEERELTRSEKQDVESHIYKTGETMFNAVNPLVQGNFLSLFLDEEENAQVRTYQYLCKEQDGGSLSTLGTRLARLVGYKWLAMPERAHYKITAKGLYARSIYLMEAEKKDYPAVVKKKAAPKKRKVQRVYSEEEDDFEEVAEQKPAKANVKRTRSYKVTKIINPSNNTETRLACGDIHYEILKLCGNGVNSFTTDEIFEVVKNLKCNRNNLYTSYLSKQVKDYHWLTRLDGNYTITKLGIVARQRLAAMLGRQEVGQELMEIDAENQDELDDDDQFEDHLTGEVDESEGNNNAGQVQQHASVEEEQAEVVIVENVNPVEQVFFDVHPLAMQGFLLKELHGQVLPALVQDGNLLQTLLNEAKEHLQTTIAKRFQDNWQVNLGPDFGALLDQKLKVRIEFKGQDGQWKTLG